jgi:hypothetical protein
MLPSCVASGGVCDCCQLTWAKCWHGHRHLIENDDGALYNVVSSVDRNVVNMCEWSKTDSARPWDGFSPSVRWFWPACFFRDLGHPLSRVKPRKVDLIRLQEHHFRSIIASDGGPVDRRITHWCYGLGSTVPYSYARRGKAEQTGNSDSDRN